MYGLRKSYAVLDLRGMYIPDYSLSTPIIRAKAEALFSEYLPCEYPPWPRVRERMISKSSSLPDSVYLAFHLQLATVSRANEILSITGADVDSENNLLHLVQTKTKTKRAVLVPPVLIAAIRILDLGQSDKLFPTINYKYYLRCLFRYGLLWVENDRRHDKTHFLRYLPALARHCAQMSVSEIQRVMGHKVPSSTLHYLAALPEYLNQLEERR